MTESMDDIERAETDSGGEKKKREMTLDELLECPTGGCDGYPEPVPLGIWMTGGELWKVWCPKCKGWMSQYLVPEGRDGYEAGVRIWLSWRKGGE